MGGTRRVDELRNDPGRAPEDDEDLEVEVPDFEEEDREDDAAAERRRMTFIVMAP